MTTIPVILNGEHRDIPEGSTAEDVVLLAGADARQVAVVLNEEIVRPADRSNTRISNNDRIDLLVFAGGG